MDLHISVKNLHNLSVVGHEQKGGLFLGGKKATTAEAVCRSDIPILCHNGCKNFWSPYFRAPKPRVALPFKCERGGLLSAIELRQLHIRQKVSPN